MKKWMKYGLVAAVVWFIISQPANAADLTKRGASALGSAGDSFATFVNHLR